MTSDKKDRPSPTLDDLFALKRAERPPEEFWNDFQREFHVRQRAAAIEPKRWWFVLPRVFAQFSRYQMPIGATAVLAVTFLSFREYREPGLEIAYTSNPTVSVPMAAPEAEIESTTNVRLGEDMQPSPVVAAVPAPAPAPAEIPQQVSRSASLASADKSPVTISPMVVWAGVASQEPATQREVDSPSARSIAANLAAIKAEQPEIVPALGDARLQLTSSAPISEPLASVAAPATARRPLFVFRGNSEAYASNDSANEGPDIHGRIASRLSDDQLYESVRRVTAGGDRLTLKF
jgi:hypothetical protein